MADQENSKQSNLQVSPPVAETKPRQATAEESRQELNQAIAGSNQVLASATTAAITIFPDTVTLDRAKLTVTKRRFFSSAEVMSIRIEDILNVTTTVGPIFGSVKVVSRVMNNERPYTIRNFWRKDAARLKRIVQGYIIALQRNIDCSALPTKDLAKLLDQLGEDDHDV